MSMTNVVTMLTNNDLTVENALKVFEDNKNADVKFWGFKDTNISLEDTKELIAAMKKAGKITCYEPLGLDEESCIKSAQIAIDCGFDYVLSMMYFKKSADMLLNHGIKYFPTCGKRAGMPRKLYGTPAEIFADAKRILSNGVDGISLSVYRYADGDPHEMARYMVQEMNAIGKSFSISGGINSFERLEFVRSLKPWGFTIGTALFDNSFGSDNTICEKLNTINKFVNG